MTDQRLSLAIVVPIVTMAAMFTVFFTLQSAAFNRRIDDLKESVGARLANIAARM
jgi:hypothetical protein